MIRAVAIQQENPFKAAAVSAENFAKFAVDLMYGTPKRIECTMAVMMLMISVCLSLSMLSKTLLQTCPV